MNNGEHKTFHAVGLVRSIRDQFVREIEGIGMEDELLALQSIQLDDPRLDRLAQRAAQQGAPAAGPSGRR